MEAARPETRRFTVDEVLRMVDSGILREDEPVELIHGELVIVSPQGPPHATATTLLRDRLMAAYPAAHTVREAKPLVAGTAELPEPDLAVVRGSVRDYATRHPGGTDAVLVVEVARTSHAADRAKVATYAIAGVAVYWLLDLVARRLEVYTEPQPDGHYRMVRVLAPTDVVELPSTTMTLCVADILA